jgi:hypothetical protein
VPSLYSTCCAVCMLLLLWRLLLLFFSACTTRCRPVAHTSSTNPRPSTNYWLLPQVQRQLPACLIR